ncbi:MAG: hypothetical protein ACHBN1_32100 [Heteroscytonema crispum UTEX LB 1556]
MKKLHHLIQASTESAIERSHLNTEFVSFVWKRLAFIPAVLFL